METLSTYEHLGSVVSEDGKIEAEITNRASRSTKVNKTILGYKDIDIKIKMKVHNAVKIPVIMHAREN